MTTSADVSVCDIISDVSVYDHSSRCECVSEQQIVYVCVCVCVRERDSSSIYECVTVAVDVRVL